MGHYMCFLPHMEMVSHTGRRILRSIVWDPRFLIVLVPSFIIFMNHAIYTFDLGYRVKHNICLTKFKYLFFKIFEQINS